MNNDRRAEYPPQNWRNDTASSQRSHTSTGPYGVGADLPPAQASVQAHWKGENPQPQSNNAERQGFAPRNPKQRLGQNSRPATARPYQRQPSSSSIELLLRQMCNDFRELFRSLFSKQATNIFKFDLAPLTWALLLCSNVLAFALSIATTKSLLFAGTFSFGSSFAWGLLEISCLLLASLGLLFLTSILARGEKRPALQFVKTLAVATLPASLAYFLLIPLAILQASFAYSLHHVPLFIFVLTLQMGYNKIHASKQNGTYWYFCLLFAVLAALSHFLP